MPAVHITLLGKLKRPRIFQCHPSAFANFLAEPVHALLGDHILQARMLAIRAVAEITVHRQHRLGYFNEIFRLEESHHIRHARIGLLIVMAHAHAPASGEVVTDQLAVLLDCDKAHAVGKHIRVVQRRDYKRHLEFPRQIRFAIQRILMIIVLQLERLALHPDLMISLGRRQKRVTHTLGILINLLSQTRGGGCGRRQYVAVHVPARRQRVGQRLIDALHQLAQAALHHAVKLKTLPRGHPQGLVAILLAQAIVGQVHLRRHHSARNAAANHKHVLLTLLTHITVILLINPVKLQELLVIRIKHLRLRIMQRDPDIPRQRRVFRLDDLIFRQFWLSFRHST